MSCSDTDPGALHIIATPQVSKSESKFHMRRQCWNESGHVRDARAVMHAGIAN